jgi:signal transduction histidine kinase/ActR/RegA family two-component response regulator
VKNDDPASCDRRVLVLAPTSRDASATGALLARAAIPHEVCASFDSLLEKLREGAAAILIPEEVVTPDNQALLADVLIEQPPWSDLPVLVLTRPGADSEVSRRAAETLGNVTLLERPVRVATLLSALRTALRARNRQYEIREHLEERVQAEQALRLADRRKDEFLATLGHELRNPLAPLLTGLQLIKLTDLQDPAAVRVTEVMDRQVKHLVRLVDDLLEVSRITRGLIDVRREPLDLGSVLRSAIDTSRPLLESAGHELSVEIPPDPIMVDGDSVRLTQVFANLLTNAAKYTDSGGRIWLTAAVDGDRAVVRVRDTGIGIPPGQLASVFEMFTQVDRSKRRAQGGLGIGLTLVRSLVAMHGGTVNARSAGLGQGSEFIVVLPLHAGDRVSAQSVQAPEKLPPHRILVVDDNRDAAEMHAALLTALGATVAVVHTGPAAINSLESFKPHAVLLDIGMPGMDGYEVARRIRRTPGHADVLLIGLTGWGQEYDYRRSRAAGFDHHLVKPLDIDKLRALLTADWQRTGETAR